MVPEQARIPGSPGAGMALVPPGTAAVPGLSLIRAQTEY